MLPFKYNWRSMRVRWVSTLMTVVGIGLTVSVFLAMMSLVRGLESTFTETGYPLNLLLLRQGGTAESTSVLSRQNYEVVRYLPGIAPGQDGEPLVSPEIIVLINHPKKDGGTTNISIRGLTPRGLEIRPTVRMIEGRFFRGGLREVIVSRKVKERFQGMDLGERVRFGKGNWTVVGVFDAGQTAYGSEVWTDVDELGTDFDRPIYSSIVLRAADEAAIPRLKEAIAADRWLRLKVQRETEYWASQTRTAMPVKALGYFIAIVMAVGSAFAAMNTMYAAVAHRTREIATLRTVGFRRRTIVLSFLLESALLGLAGGLVGCLVALPLHGLATGTTNFVTFSEVAFNFRITPRLLLQALAFAAVMGAAGGLFPARRAASMKIVEALREL
ncbi:MAG: ABC transporter permease [Acidobacteria bacterium]|nr:ABC transporter permease [Acidobacteriota bacterium]